MARNMKDESTNRKSTQKSNQNCSNRTTQRASNTTNSGGDCGCGTKRGGGEKKK